MPIVPMTGKPKDSLYPEPEEQKIEINPLSYLNTPDTATEAEFAVAVDELAKMSPFGIRETGDYSQFGADNAKDAFSIFARPSYTASNRCQTTSHAPGLKPTRRTSKPATASPARTYLRRKK